MRKKIIAGNWKMNKAFADAEELISDIAEGIEDLELKNTEVVLCPPSIYLEMASDIAEESEFKVGAQNISDKEWGAYTGEISAAMLQSMEISYCIIGHSERRKYFQEDHALLAAKVDQALTYEVAPIFCCGELLQDRDAGRHFEIVKTQLQESLFHLTKEEMRNVVVAYEPVWAIGTGMNATAQQAQEMHAFIRKTLAEKYDADTASQISILYGGSCNAKNAKEIFSQPDVDGVLIGGASLNADEFIQIIKSI